MTHDVGWPDKLVLPGCNQPAFFAPSLCVPQWDFRFEAHAAGSAPKKYLAGVLTFEGYAGAVKQMKDLLSAGSK